MNNNDIVPGFDDEKDEGLKICLHKIDEVPCCLVLYLNGYIDTYNVKEFDMRIAKAINAGFIRLIFHLSGFRIVSELIISSLAGFLKLLESKGGDLVLANVPPKVYEIFQLLGFSHFFNTK